MKIRNILLLLIALLAVSSSTTGQENTGNEENQAIVKDTKPVRSPFASGLLLERATIVNYRAKTLEMVMQHRFGNLNSGNFDLLGIYGAANIRLGFNYSIWDRFQVGIGTSKNRLVQDLNWKWSILQQTRKNRIPIAISYHGNVGVEAQKKINYDKVAHRFSYFHEVMFARKFNKVFTAQLNFSYAHFNVVDSSSFIPEDATEPIMHDRKHDNFGVGLAGRIKATDQLSVIFEYDQPLIFLEADQSQPNLSLGVEIATSSHAFQVFLGSYRSILPQYNLVYNDNKFWKGDIMLGFNITRLWSF